MTKAELTQARRSLAQKFRDRRPGETVSEFDQRPKTEAEKAAFLERLRSRMERSKSLKTEPLPDPDPDPKPDPPPPPPASAPRPAQEPEPDSSDDSITLPKSNAPEKPSAWALEQPTIRLEPLDKIEAQLIAPGEGEPTNRMHHRKVRRPRRKKSDETLPKSGGAEPNESPTPSSRRPEIKLDTVESVDAMLLAPPEGEAWIVGSDGWKNFRLEPQVYLRIQTKSWHDGTVQKHGRATPDIIIRAELLGTPGIKAVQKLISRVEAHCRNHGYPFAMSKVVKHRTGYLRTPPGGEGGATVTVGLTAEGHIAECRIIGTPDGEHAARLFVEAVRTAEWRGIPLFHTDGPQFVAEKDAKKFITYKTRKEFHRRSLASVLRWLYRHVATAVATTATRCSPYARDLV